MTDKRQHGGEGGTRPAPGAGGGPDDEITLETTAETTLETTAETTLESTAETTTEFKVAAAPGWAARLEGLAAARKERRRRVATRVWQAAIPVVVIVIIVMVILSIFGGLGGGETVLSTTSTVPSLPSAGSGVLLVEEGGSIPLGIVLQPWDKGGVVLALPGIALVEADGVFLTISEIYEAGRGGAVTKHLSEALALPVGPAASVEWADLRAAMAAAGVGGVPEGRLSYSEGGFGTMAEALRTFVAVYVSAQGMELWDGLKMGGNKEGFTSAVGVDARSMSDTTWEAVELNGSVVTGEGFVYLEPDFEEARRLLGTSSVDALVSVEVTDGAGIVGAAEKAGDLLEAAGYVLLPMGYAEAFPSVEQTKILVASGIGEQGEAVRALLGVGIVTEDSTLEAGYVVVILGADFGGADVSGDSP